MYDVIIAGGGPVGLYSARLCKDAGLKYIVLEEHDEIGKPNHCSGLVSTNLGKFMKIDKNFIEHEVKGCILHSKSKHVKFTKTKTAAYVLSREKFDKHLSKGVNINFSEKLLGFTVDPEKVTAETDNGKIEARMLLACDGSNSFVRKAFGQKPKEVLTGIIAIENTKDTNDHVELWFDKDKLSDGFFWKIPRGQSTEYGMIGSRADFTKLEEFFGVKDYEKRAGAINIGPVKSYWERVLLIGDAACQIKPWSGGGVVYGLKCAEIAIKTTKQAIEENDFSERFLSSYEKEWKKAIGKQIRLGMLYRKLYRKSGNRRIDFIFSLMKRMPLLNRLDMDLL